MGRAEIRLPEGYSAWGISAGIKTKKDLDLGILASEPAAIVFSSFTTNQFPAAPVLFSKRILGLGNKISHILVNSGNANAATGRRGLNDSEVSAQYVKKYFRNAEEVLVASTGVIGHPLPMDKIKTGIRELAICKSSKMGDSFARSILTTDTVPKISQAELKFKTGKVKICGFAKGSGMISPKMATMLAFITTDIGLTSTFKREFQKIVDESFNSISVDGDMSTNDTVLLMCNGASGIKYGNLSTAYKTRFLHSLKSVCVSLARQIVRDGEGATKLIEVNIRGAKTHETARNFFQVIANSPLVKTAFFGNDPNWGRVIAAAGSLKTPLDPGKVSLEFCGIKVFNKGMPVNKPSGNLPLKMKQREVSLTLDLNMGKANWTGWTCDLTYDYVKINADYHT